MSDYANAQARAEHAKRLLTDPLFVEARQTVEDELKDMIVSLPLSAREEREQAVAILKGSEQFFRVFALIMHNYSLHQSEMLSEAQTKARMEQIEESLNGY